VTIKDQLNLLIGLCTFILVFQLWPEKQRGHEEQASANRNEGHSARAYHIRQRLLMFICKPKHWYPDDNRHETIERKFWRWQFWVSFATLIFLIVGSGIALNTFRETQRQARAAIEANRISNASFVSTQRAYMYFSGVNVRRTQDMAGVYTFWLAPTFGNSGNTPTVGLESRAECWDDRNTEPDPFLILRSKNLPWFPGFYGPHVILQATECSIKMDGAKQIRDGLAHIYLAGEARYQDSVAHPSPVHVTQFAIEFMINDLDERGGGLTGAHAQRGRHNCADKCPD
jgi:hypothetical protein